jgi:hypothetical protein
MSSILSVSDRLRKVNEHRETLISILAPSAADYHIGGSHRCWIKECAMLTADKICNEMATNKSVMKSITRKIPIPMPPAWNGSRPSETEEYGHTASAWKDSRHFENTLSYALAKRGYICSAKYTDNYKAICIAVDTMMHIALLGATEIDDTTYMEPEYPTHSYDEWCDNLNECMEREEAPLTTQTS